MHRRRRQTAKISPILLSLALFETILWISFSFCVLSSASSTSSVVAGDAQPVQSFIQSQNQFLVTTTLLERKTFEEPESFEQSEASASILLQEQAKNFASLKDHPPETFVPKVPEVLSENFNQNFRGASQNQGLSVVSEEQEGKEGNSGKELIQ